MTTTLPTWHTGDRMRKALQDAEISAGDMADYIGVSRTTVSTWLSGRATPRTSALKLWALRCRVPYEWFQMDPGAVQAAELAMLTERFPELRAGHDPEADAGAPPVKLSRLDSNQQPSD